MDRILKYNNKLISWNNEMIRVTSPVISTYPTDGLLGRWAFDDDTLEDSYGTADFTNKFSSPEWGYNTGLIDGCIDSSISDKNAHAVTLYNADSTLIANQNGVSEFTWSLWLRITNASQDHCHFMTAVTSSDVWVTGLAFAGPAYTPSGGATGAIYFTGVAETVKTFSTTDIRDNDWHHIVAGYDGTKQHLYLDNVEQGTAGGTTRGTAGTADQLTIGGAPQGAIGGTAPSYNINGFTDQVYIYNKWITTAERTQLYNSGAGV